MARFAKAAGQSRVSASAILLALVAGLLFWNMAIDRADATHEPADKVAAASNRVDDLPASSTGPDTQVTRQVLQERMRVSSLSDLILQLTSECALFTQITTGEEDNNAGPDVAESRAQIELRVLIDGEPVPVSTADSDPAPGTQTDDGWVVFCNRVYHATATDDTDADGDIDEYDTYIKSRTANAFNWLALNVGSVYDSPTIPAGEGNNIVEVIVEARYTTGTTGSATAEAMVGKRSLIIESTHASVHEEVLPADTGGN